MSEIVGIGVDMIEIRRVTEAYHKESFRNRYFTPEEQQLIMHKEARAATAFAAKEAVVKAFGTGFSGIAPIEINVLRDLSGKPTVTLLGNAKQKAESLGIDRILLSIADTKEMAIAYATAVSDSTGTGS